MSGSLDEPRDEHAPVEPYGDTADPTLAWVLLQHVQPDAGTPTIPSLSSPSSAVDITENNFGAMFEQFVSSVRIGKQGDLACVSLTLDLGGTAPVHVMIEETSMGPTIELQSDNPAEAFALEQALKTKQGSKHPR